MRLEVGSIVYCKIEREWVAITGYFPAHGDIYMVATKQRKFAAFGEDLLTLNEFDIKFGRCIDGKSAIRSNKGSCDHKWMTYQGFTDSYRFCTACDQKEK